MDKNETKISVTMVGKNGNHETRNREKWSNQIDFLASMTSSCIGLGNVWRFPYLCYQNGGGAFLLPYFVCVIFGGIPLFFLEVSLGQMTSSGVLTAWKICPLMQGIGASGVCIQIYGVVYYIIVMTWTIFYFYSSFTLELPWSHCQNDWNTANCTIYEYKNNNNTILEESFSNLSRYASSSSKYSIDPIDEFWERKVLQITNGIDEAGAVKWDLAVCLMIAWVIVYLFVFQGIKVSGKLMYVTSTFPIVLLLILLVRGITLPGSLDGIKFYVIPNFKRLLDFKVWADAGSQVFYTYSLCIGSAIAMGSYNQFHHNCWRDSLILAVINSAVSLTSGFVVFSTLGFMSYQQHVAIKDVAESGPGLAFIAYPKAVMEMPLAPLWAVLFFLTILMLGMGSQVINVQGFFTAIFDQFPNHFTTQMRKGVFSLLICCIFYLLGLPMITKGGMYVFQLVDYYAVGRNIILVGFAEVITIAYLYGIGRYCSNLEIMLGFPIGPYLKISWLFTSPVYTLTTFGMLVYSYTEITYNKTYRYPNWSVVVGWFMALLPLVMIPLFAVVNICKESGSLKQRLKATLEPRINTSFAEAELTTNTLNRASSENIHMGEIISTSFKDN